MSWLTGGGKSGHLESWTAERRGQGSEQERQQPWGCQILGGLETCPQGLGSGWGWLGWHLSGSFPTPEPLPGTKLQVQFAGAQESTCQMPGAVLGAWGCTDVRHMPCPEEIAALEWKTDL